MRNILRIWSIVTLVAFFICLSPLLESKEIDIRIKGGKARCSSDLEPGNVFDFHLEMPFFEKFVFQSGIEYFTYNFTFTSWGNLLILVPSKIIVTDFKVVLGIHYNIFSIKKTIFPYIRLSPSIHIVQSEVRPNGETVPSLPFNMQPYEHFLQIVPGISANAGIKVVLFNLPFYAFGEGECFAVPAWNKYLIGHTDNWYITTQSLKVGFGIKIL